MVNAQDVISLSIGDQRAKGAAATEFTADIVYIAPGHTVVVVDALVCNLRWRAFRIRQHRWRSHRDQNRHRHYSQKTQIIVAPHKSSYTLPDRPPSSFGASK